MIAKTMERTLNIWKNFEKRFAKLFENPKSCESQNSSFHKDSVYAHPLRQLKLLKMQLSSTTLSFNSYLLILSLAAAT